MSLPQLSELTPLYWLLLLPVLGAGMYYSLVRRPALMKWFSFLLRVAGVVLLVLAMCYPEWAGKSDGMHFSYLVDVSQSVDLADALKALDEIDEEGKQLGSGDSMEVFVFADKLRGGKIGRHRELLKKWKDTFGEANFRSETALAGVMSGSRLGFRQGKGKALVVYTDGRGTTGDVAAALRALDKDGIKVVLRRLGGLSKPEAGVAELTPSSPALHVGEKVLLTARLFSNIGQKAEVSVLNRGVVISKKTITLKPGADNIYTCEAVADSPGITRWQVQLRPQQDYFVNNNSAACTVNARGKMKVLAIHNKPGRLRHFRRVLAKQKIDFEARAPVGIPRTLGGLLEFDAIILADVSADKLGNKVMENIRRYVVDFGGGLIMTGSENSFGLGGYYRTPLEAVLPMTSRFEKEKEAPSLSVGLVIDKSGSMGGIKIVMARNAAASSVDLLSSRDYAAVVAFDGQPYTVVELTSAVRKQDIIDGIGTIAAGGGTNMYPAMVSMRELLGNSPSKVRHMIVLGDGHSSPGPFVELAGDAHTSGITISTIALGQGADGNLLKAVADAGGGRFYATFNPEDVPAIFARETVEASRSAIKEEPFMPVAVPGQTFLDGIDLSETPFLLGFVMTRFKPAARPVLATETGEPLMAFGRYGIGKSVAFASGIDEQWAGEWLDWSDFGKFWAQTLRAVSRSGAPAGTRLLVDKKGGRAKITVIREPELNNPEVVENWKGVVSYPGGKRREIVFKPEGLGLYSWEGGIDGDSYEISAAEKDRQSSVQKNMLSTYKKEYSLADKPDRAVSEAGFTARNVLPPRQSGAISWNSLREWAVGIALLCCFAGILLRRI